MSNGLHHVAPASFFPTAKELSSGLQWFKEHPILAAAAATAVSVITYLHTADDDDVDAVVQSELLAGDDDIDIRQQDDGRDNRHGTGTAAASAVSVPHTFAGALPSSTSTRPPRRRASSPSVLTTTDAAHASPLLPPRRASTPLQRDRATPPALRKPGSEGRMSPAAVTWVDEHGGSLTQVFEHLVVTDHIDEHDDEIDGHGLGSPFPDLDGPMRGPRGILSASQRPQGRPPTPRASRNAKPADAADADVNAEDEAFTTMTATSPLSGHWMGPLGVPSPQLAAGAATLLASGERQTESPQWGWYVPITPPQDHFTGSLPRAVMASSSSSSSATRSAAAVVAATLQTDSLDASSSSMRRSASGRIKAA